MDELRVILKQKVKEIKINDVTMFIYPTPGYYIILTDENTILVTPSIYLKISPEMKSLIIGDEYFNQWPSKDYTYMIHNTNIKFIHSNDVIYNKYFNYDKYYKFSKLDCRIYLGENSGFEVGFINGKYNYIVINTDNEYITAPDVSFFQLLCPKRAKFF